MQEMESPALNRARVYVAFVVSCDQKFTSSMEMYWAILHMDGKGVNQELAPNDNTNRVNRAVAMSTT